MAARQGALRWAMSMYEGTSPLGLRVPPGFTNPVLTAADVSDVDAEFVADPFIVSPATAGTCSLKS